MVIFLSFLLWMFTATCAHVDVRMLVVPAHGKEIIALDNNTAHSSFVNWFNNVTNDKIKSGLHYSLCHAKHDPNFILNEMNANRYTALQFFYSLVSGETAYSKILVEVISKHNKSSPTSLANWIETNFKLPKQDVETAFTNFVQLTDKNTVTYLKRFFIVLGEKYDVLNRYVKKHEFSMVKWILENNNDVSSVTNTSLQLLWSKKEFELLNMILSKMNEGNSPLILQKISSLIDKEFLKYVFVQKYSNIIKKIQTSENIDYCIFLTAVLETKRLDLVGVDLNAVKCASKSSQALLHAAVSASRVDIAKYLIEKGMSVNSCDENGTTPIFVATENGDLEMIKYLLSVSGDYNSTICGKTPLSVAVSARKKGTILNLINLGASPLVPDEDGENPFYKAILLNDTDAVKIMARNAYDLDYLWVNRTSPVHYAVQKGNNEMLRTVLSLGCDPNLIDNVGKTPVVYATKLNDTIKILYLVEYGGDVHLTNELGETPLHIACKSSSISTIRTLTVLGSNVNAISKEDDSPIHICVKRNRALCIEYLVMKGADINARIENGGTLQHLAAKHGAERSVRALLAHGLSLSFVDRKKDTPLITAVKCNQPGVISLISHLGGNVNVTSESGDSLLHIAVDHGNVEAMRVLMQLGLTKLLLNKKHESPVTRAIIGNNFDVVREIMLAEPLTILPAYVTLAASHGALESIKAMNSLSEINLKDSKYYKDDHLIAAVKGNHSNIVKYLIEELEYKPNVKTKSGDTLMHLAADIGSTKVLEMLIRSNVSVDAVNDRGDTPIWLSAKRGCVGGMMVLRESGADIHQRRRREPWENGTLLHAGTSSGNKDAVTWLLSKELNINSEDVTGTTAMHIAADLGFQDIIEELLEQNADPDVKIISGMTPLHIASYHGFFNITKNLLEYGADITPQTLINITPLHLAASKGHTDIVKLLLKNGGGVDIQDETGWTPLHWAAYNGSSMSIEAILENHKQQKWSFDPSVVTVQWKIAQQIANQKGNEENVNIIGEFLSKMSFSNPN